MQSGAKSTVRKNAFVRWHLFSTYITYIYFLGFLYLYMFSFFKDAAGALGASVQKLCTYLNKVLRIKEDRIINK